MSKKKKKKKKSQWSNLGNILKIKDRKVKPKKETLKLPEGKIRNLHIGEQCWLPSKCEGNCFYRCTYHS